MIKMLNLETPQITEGDEAEKRINNNPLSKKMTGLIKQRLDSSWQLH